MKSENIEIINFVDIQTGNPHQYQVGRNQVLSIVEHCAKGEGDKWYYDVNFDDGKTLRIFNPDSIIYKRD
jgi:hypothetical protein